MEQKTKKIIVLVVATGCLVFAATITFFNHSRKAGGIESLKSGVMLWMKCGKTECGHEFQMDRKDYYKFSQQYIMNTPPMQCPKCQQKSVYHAYKCSKCENVFFAYMAKPDDFQDRCPKCGYSQEEVLRREPNKNR